MQDEELAMTSSKSSFWCKLSSFNFAHPHPVSFWTLNRRIRDLSLARVNADEHKTDLVQFSNPFLTSIEKTISIFSLFFVDDSETKTSTFHLSYLTFADNNSFFFPSPEIFAKFQILRIETRLMSRMNQERRPPLTRANVSFRRTPTCPMTCSTVICAPSTCGTRHRSRIISRAALIRWENCWIFKKTVY